MSIQTEVDRIKGLRNSLYNYLKTYGKEPKSNSLENVTNSITSLDIKTVRIVNSEPTSSDGNNGDIFVVVRG